LCVTAGVLVGGTASGKVGMWKYVSDVTSSSSSGSGGGRGVSNSSERCWKLQPPVILNRPVTSLSVRPVYASRRSRGIT